MGGSEFEGAKPSGLKTSYTVETDTYTPPNASAVTGYDFMGWNPVNIPKGSTGNKTFNANWLGYPYTVTYNGNGHTGGSTPNSSHRYGTESSLSPHGFSRTYQVTIIPNYTGASESKQNVNYSLTGWATSASGTKVYNDQAMVLNLTSVRNGTVTLYAKWQQNGMTLPNLTRPTHRLEGWYTAATGGTKVGNAGATYIPTSNITLYAHWVEETVTITFHKNA